MAAGDGGHHHHGAEEPQAYARMLERLNRFQEPEVRAAIAALHLPAGSHGLDVGCGVGLYTLWLAEAVGPRGRVMGIDHVAERIEAARRLAGAVLPEARLVFQEGDGTAITAADRSFDWIWCADVLHHMDDPVQALKEFMRVLRPGGRIIIKESQVLQALFLPGYPELERQLQRAEMQYHRQEAGAQSFQERRQRTRQAMLAAGLPSVQVQTYLVQRQAPLDEATRAFIQEVVFARNWGPRIRGFLDAQDWQQRSALCEPEAPTAILARPDYYCIYPFTLFTAELPATAR